MYDIDQEHQNASMVAHEAVMGVVHVTPELSEEFAQRDDVTLRERIAATGLGQIVAAGYRDLRYSENKLATGAGLAGVVAVEAVGATRVPSVLSLPAAMYVQQQTGVPIVAGAVAGLGYGAWTTVVAKTLNNAVNNLPQTFEKIDEAIPQVDRLSRVLPGLEPSEKQPLSTRAGRGFAAYSVGVMLYIAAASMQNQTKEERAELGKNIGIDAAMFLGSVATVSAGIVMATQEKYPEVGDQIMSHSTNVPFMFALMLGVTTARVGLSKLRERLFSGKRASIRKQKSSKDE